MVRQFCDIRVGDVSVVGGKGANLGEFGIYIVQPVADILSVVIAVLVAIFRWNKIFED